MKSISKCKCLCHLDPVSARWNWKNSCKFEYLPLEMGAPKLREAEMWWRGILLVGPASAYRSSVGRWQLVGAEGNLVTPRNDYGKPLRQSGKNPFPRIQLVMLMTHIH